MSDEEFLKRQIDIRQQEIERLQSKNKKIQTILRTRARQDRKRKAKLRKLRLETTNQRLKLERLHSIINELEKWVEYQATHTMQQHNYYGVLDKIRELKGSDKE